MKTKLCPRCTRRKQRSLFYTRSNGRPSAYCKRCSNAFSASYHLKHGPRLIKERTKRVTLTRHAMRIWIDSLKNKPCVDCKFPYPPYVMHFDHLYGKSYNISEMHNRGFSKKRILEEIAKCELVCANCHAIRTHDRQRGVAQSG